MASPLLVIAICGVTHHVSTELAVIGREELAARYRDAGAASYLSPLDRGSSRFLSSRRPTFGLRVDPMTLETTVSVLSRPKYSVFRSSRGSDEWQPLQPKRSYQLSIGDVVRIQAFEFEIVAVTTGDDSRVPHAVVSGLSSTPQHVETTCDGRRTPLSRPSPASKPIPVPAPVAPPAPFCSPTTPPTCSSPPTIALAPSCSTASLDSTDADSDSVPIVSSSRIVPCHPRVLAAEGVSSMCVLPVTSMRRHSCPRPGSRARSRTTCSLEEFEARMDAEEPCDAGGRRIPAPPIITPVNAFRSVSEHTPRLASLLLAHATVYEEEDEE